MKTVDKYDQYSILFAANRDIRTEIYMKEYERMKNMDIRRNCLQQCRTSNAVLNMVSGINKNKDKLSICCNFFGYIFH